MIVNRLADTGIIGKRRLCVNRATDQHQIMTFNNIWFLCRGKAKGRRIPNPMAFFYFIIDSAGSGHKYRHHNLAIHQIGEGQSGRFPEI